MSLMRSASAINWTKETTFCPFTVYHIDKFDTYHEDFLDKSLKSLIRMKWKMIFRIEFSPCFTNKMINLSIQMGGMMRAKDIYTLLFCFLSHTTAHIEHLFYLVLHLFISLLIFSIINISRIWFYYVRVWA